jgi:superfamily II DNA or RNA helicase
MLIENPSQQIMILAHNKSLLKYLHDAVEHRGLASVGYYVGGMKEAALKKTETKKIVIATYSMASEALDIKTLTTLIMCTPRSDIQQSIGRILREKHSQPVVVDIIDSHDLFKNQWKKRRAFYKKENYQILYTTSGSYTTDIMKWTVVFQPSGSSPGCKVNKDKRKEKENGKKDSKNTGSCKSRSSSDRSITQDSESDSETEEEPTIDIKSKNDLLCGKCLIKLKK